MTIEIIDTPDPVQRYLPRLDGVHTIIRYITSGSPSSSKQIKVAEAKAIKAAGKKLGIVHEVWGDFAHAGHGGISRGDGERDGPFAVRTMKTFSAPAGACVYFAVDVDATASQIRSNVLPYFKAVAAAFEDSPYTVGVYGPGAVCKAAIDAGYAKYGWLSNARGWSGYKAFLPRAALVQQLPTHIAGGLDVDPNYQQVPEWGQFVPFPDPVVTKPAPIPETRDEDEGGESIVHSAKSIIKSKIAWLAGLLGSTGVATTVETDPTAQSVTTALLSRPSVWFGAAFVLIALAIIYFRWRDHGRGQTQ